MNIQYIFSRAYLFDSIPPAQSRLTIFLLVFFIILILAYVYLLIQPKSLKKIYGRFQLPCLIGGVLGLIYLLARHEGLVWLGSRFFLSMIALMLLIWIGIGTYWLLVHAPKHLTRVKNEEIYQKYLPKKKR
ncbi:MAG: hypothetical protein WCO23_00335 [bacterium]